MKGKIVLVTGSTDGIGQQTALELARMGAHVLVHGRSEQRAAAVRDEIRRLSDNPHVDAIAADLAALRHMRQLANTLRQRYDRLDVLINNAGVFMNERRLTEDGLEMTFAVNHLAPFLLTQLLMDSLQAAHDARIITVSSVAHQRATVDFDDLQGERQFDGYRAYALSKLGNILFTYELAERLAGTGITANCLHPGVITTKLLQTGFNMSGASLQQGAATSVYLASSQEVANVTGTYFVDKRPTPSAPLTHDRELRQRFWRVSEELTETA